MRESTELRVTRMLFVASFLLATVLLMVLSLAYSIKSNIAATYLWGAALVFGTILIGRCTGARKRYLRLFLLAAVLNLLIVPPELYLRLRGFRFESGIQFGYPRPHQFDVFEPDEHLFWRYPLGRPGVNSYGFEGREPARPKRAGTYRILFLGNSCTWQGHPEMVELMLGTSVRGVECLNFATPGYTSHQGTVIAKRYFAELEPDLLVVSYGWNDRWLAYGAPDEGKWIVPARGGPFSRLIDGFYSRCRLLQFFRKALSPVFGRVEPLAVSRVPLESFRRNLEEIGAAARTLGAPVIFVTEPSSHSVAGVPDYVVDGGYSASKDVSLELFARYNGALRDVAAEDTSWFLIDLDTALGGRPDVRRLFAADGLHFSKAGMAVVAEIETRFILERILSRHGTAD